MKITGIGCAPKLRAMWLAAFISTGLLLVQTGSLQAQSGSWGSGGSWGSHGGSSGGGLFGGRQPLRNLLGRIGGRFSGGSSGGYTGGSSGGYTGGSSGGYSGGSSGGYHGGSYGGSSGGYGSHGSTGSSWGSTGYSSLGSTGSSGGSTGYGSSGSSYGSTGSSYGSMGSSYLGSVGGYNQSYPAPMETSYSTPIYDSGYSMGGYSSPMVDSGYSMNGGIPFENSYPGNGGIIDSNSLNPVPGVYYDGGITTPSAPATDSTNPPTPPNPGPTEGGDSTDITKPADQSAVLNLLLPSDAKVFINEKLTRTAGEKRSYVSRNLKPLSDYHYQVKAVLVRDGQEIVRTQLVTIEAGASKTVEFDFETAPVTTLAINVPADAQIKLCGKETVAKGDLRHFATSKLESGMTWKDYTVEVSVQRAGKTVRQEKKLDLLAGETYSLDFDFDSTSEKIAAK